jgi:tetratricopeptide (TPR) repeat protein
VETNLLNLGLVYLERGQLSLSEEYHRQALGLAVKRYGENNPELVEFIHSLGIVLTAEKKFTEAETSLRRALSLRLLQLAPDHFRVAMTNSALGDCLAEQKKFKDAEPLLIESYLIIRKQFGNARETREAGLRLIALYESTGRTDKANAIKAELGVAK